ncbi:MAG: ABC transporter ATP-binding protein [Oligosphaeraceae bacterium]
MQPQQMVYDVRGLCRSFTLNGDTIRVLDDVTFTIAQGSWVALIGPSGCGKTTLLQLLGGLDRPNSGQILIHGQDIARLSSRRLTALRRRSIGFIFQSYHLFPELTALENVALPALGWRCDREAVYRRAQDWLDQFGLHERLHHLPQELSGGEQQRVAMARALINDPDIILADEPTGNLDPAATAQIVDIIGLIRARRNPTIVMVTHDMQLAAKAERTIPLKKL